MTSCTAYGDYHADALSAVKADHVLGFLTDPFPGVNGRRREHHPPAGRRADDDLAKAARAAVINKRVGGAGLVVSRTSFQRPWNEGVRLLHAVQDVCLDPDITIA